jgi:hypothetical protein
MSRTKTIKVTVEPEMFDAVDRVCEAEERSLASFVRIAIAEALRRRNVR